MKIIDETKQNCTFSTLEPGDCFKELEGSIFLRIKDIYNEIGGIEFNAVFLSDGEPTFFNDNETVVLLETVLTVR